MEKKNNVKGILKYIVKTISMAVLVVLVTVGLLLLFVFISTKVASKKGARPPINLYTIISPSMTPNINVYDVVVAVKADTSKLKVGDDVVYQGSVGTFAGKIVTHQIVQIEEGSPRKFHTKGINNMIEDPVIDESQIFGRVVMKLSILSIISKLISNQYGFFFIIFVPIVVLVFGIFMDTVNDKKKRVDSHEEAKRGKRTKKK